jgi:hypothetical protein
VSEPDPDVIRGTERVIGETCDPGTGQWKRPPEPVVIVHAQPATASGGTAPGDED